MTTEITSIELGAYLQHLDTYVSEEIRFQLEFTEPESSFRNVNILADRANRALHEMLNQADIRIVADNDTRTLRFAYTEERSSDEENMLDWWVENTETIHRSQGTTITLDPYWVAQPGQTTDQISKDPAMKAGYYVCISGWEYSGTYCRDLLTLVGRILSQGFIPEGEFTPFS